MASPKLPGVARPAPPESVTELCIRAESLANHSVAAVARALAIALPTHGGRAKGFVGQLVEHALGASAGSAPIPDFPALAVELKTIPLDSTGRPRESTWVCVVPGGPQPRSFAESGVAHKLGHVLFVPYVTDPALPLGEAMFRDPLLWRPSDAQRATLERDWRELTELVAIGDAAAIRSEMGEALQIRPKGAHGRDHRKGLGAEGTMAPRMGLGFYLRPSFTRTILNDSATTAS